MESIQNKDIDDSLKFEISRFSDSCFDIYKNLIDDNIKKSFDQLYQKIDSEIKTNIAQKIGGNELYNYDDIPEITVFIYDSKTVRELYNFTEFCTILSTETYCFLSENIENLSQYKDFIKFSKNEKIIMDYHFVLNDKRYGDNKDYQMNCEMLITNFGNMLMIEKYNTDHKTNVTLKKNNFWLPLDYINIIHKICNQAKTSKSQLTMTYHKSIKDDGWTHLPIGAFLSNPTINFEYNHMDPIIIYNIVDELKEILYNRKFIPLYVKDVVEENKQLKSKYDKYEKDIMQFTDEKKEFETKYKPHLDLVKEFCNIEKEKNMLKLVAIKLEFEKKTIK